MSEPVLWQNAVFIPEDNVYLLSSPAQPDEPVSHTYAKDGSVLTIAGGHSYARRDGDFMRLSHTNRYEEWTLTSDHPFEVVAERFLLLQPHRDESTGKAAPWRLKPIKEMDVAALIKLVDSKNRLGRPDWALIERIGRHWLDINTQTTT